MSQTVILPDRHGGESYTRVLTEVPVPDLPFIDWASIGHTKPIPVTDKDWDPDQSPIEIDLVIITWTAAEWAALDHVFCNSDTPMPYKYHEDMSWQDGWKYYHANWPGTHVKLPNTAPSLEGHAWGRCRIVQFPSNQRKALLFKSDMHLNTDGPDLPLRFMVEQIIKDFKPALILTVGTAGGSRNQDCLGTTNITNTAHLELVQELGAGGYWFNHKTFSNDWIPDQSFLDIVCSLLMQTPVTWQELEVLREANAKSEKLIDPITKTTYSLNQLVTGEIQPEQIPPQINVLPGIPVLTTNNYGVGNTSGNYDQYSALEMDDAIIAMIAGEHSIQFGVVRNISDPVQNASLTADAQGTWGGIIYAEYGLYTSYNGALAAWGIAASADHP